jgi:hypothetical protein
MVYISSFWKVQHFSGTLVSNKCRDQCHYYILGPSRSVVTSTWTWVSSSIWLNHLVVGQSIGTFSLKLTSNALLGIFVQSILFTWPNHCTRFSKLINNILNSNFWSKISFLILSLLVLPSALLSKMSYPLLGFCFLSLFKGPCFSVKH